jgi:hypothetical protein
VDVELGEYTIHLPWDGTRQGEKLGLACRSTAGSTDGAGDSSDEGAADRHKDGAGPVESHWDTQPPPREADPRTAFLPRPFQFLGQLDESN